MSIRIMSVLVSVYAHPKFCRLVLFIHKAPGKTSQSGTSYSWVLFLASTLAIVRHDSIATHKFAQSHAIDMISELFIVIACRVMK